MAPNDYDIFKAHIDRLPTIAECPMCQSITWNAEGPVVVYKHVGKERIDEIPLVLLICGVCKYTRQFAWEPILSEARAGILLGGARGG